MSSASERLAEVGRNDPRSWVEGHWYRQEEIRTDRLDTAALSVGMAQRVHEAASEIVEDAVDLLISKLSDYGPNNISRSPFGPEFGLLIRMHDKQARLVNLMSKDSEPEHEPISDTLVDLINYCVIFLLVRSNQWPGVKR